MGTLNDLKAGKLIGEKSLSLAALERLEVRAYGCLAEEMLMLSPNDTSYSKQKRQLEALKDACLNAKNEERPLFYTISQQMKDIMFPEI